MPLPPYIDYVSLTKDAAPNNVKKVNKTSPAVALFVIVSCDPFVLKATFVAAFTVDVTVADPSDLLETPYTPCAAGS